MAPRPLLAAFAALCLFGCVTLAQAQAARASRPAGSVHAHAPAPAPAPAVAASVQPAGRSKLVAVADGRLLAPDIARIVNQGELVVAMLGIDTPPFFSLKNGKLAGTDVDLALRIGKELGVPVRFDRSAQTFDGVAETVAIGQADMGISRMARTLKRAQIVHFSDVYMRLGHALLINRMRFAEMAGDQPLPQVIRNFSGRLGVIGNSAWVEFGQRNFPQAKLVSYPTWADVIKAVKQGEVVAAYRDELEVMQILRADPGLALSLRTVTFDDLDSSQRIMVGIGDDTLLAFINEVIAQRGEKPTASSVLKSIK
ncbi:substrate-binding periplasmic protein [Janthinobacterium aquaticum]|uniref:substrate-binding periplasmic protein n=1 Tax=Janthinobacterium sp. FT58W TaxID=2654254 RepID=UPI001264E54B|nr:transporter substrate-binding domain-containing protein [Janthinobacterium sp. FT58W]KAB8044241.1 transporter substrate-binding domain-containing protein [Janthinobacterium sp. FT58W]